MRLLAALLCVVLCWLCMMAAHEAGHVLNAWLSGAVVERVVLDPFDLSHTEIGRNPRPLFVAWGGAVWGVVLPALGAVAAGGLRQAAHLCRFFAGFCLVANGVYLAAGVFSGAGDPGDLVRMGVPPSLLFLAGVVLAAGGLVLWHRLGPRVGFLAYTPAQTRHLVVVLAILLAMVVAAELRLAE